ncbi:alcohol dehydrogenase catalytic domain-containing protein, partial [Alkalihalobacillus deserti]|uniref:alcohol dehydrogenase catalytic domain-containing protein n=2 Tax=Alkalihalobacillus deserti TaxID=2879466 RepID=UPI001D134934
MNIKAATTFYKGSEFTISDVSLDKPKHGEVLVRISASGICHTDLRARDQLRPVPLPIILGHEGSGIVEEIGEGVSNVQPGDHVIMSFNSCGTCNDCLKAKPYACENFPHLNFSGKMKDG